MGQGLNQVTQCTRPESISVTEREGSSARRNNIACLEGKGGFHRGAWGTMGGTLRQEEM